MAEGLTPGHWIIVPNWEKFQHYKSRDPRWIKNYGELLHKSEYIGLGLASRGLLHGLWLAYAEAKGRVKVREVPGYVSHKTLRRHWDSLLEAGFVELSASKVLAQSKREKERRANKQPPLDQPPDWRLLNQATLKEFPE